METRIVLRQIAKGCLAAYLFYLFAPFLWHFVLAKGTTCRCFQSRKKKSRVVQGARRAPSE